MVCCLLALIMDGPYGQSKRMFPSGISAGELVRWADQVPLRPKSMVLSWHTTTSTLLMNYWCTWRGTKNIQVPLRFCLSCDFDIYEYKELLWIEFFLKSPVLSYQLWMLWKHYPLLVFRMPRQSSQLNVKTSLDPGTEKGAFIQVQYF